MVKKANNTQTGNRWVKWFWRFFIGGIIFVGLLFLFAGWGLFGEMPDFKRLENPDTNLATEIITSDGENPGQVLSR